MPIARVYSLQSGRRFLVCRQRGTAMRLAIIGALLACQCLGAACPSDDKQAEIDKRAFERARKAAMVKTWDAAIAILERIDIDRVDDEEVIEYVDFSLRCAKVADEL